MLLLWKSIMGSREYSLWYVCRVGNELGAGRPRNAKMVVFATLTITPVLWLVIACILAEPHLQSALLHLYVDGSDAVLWRTLRQLLTIVAVIELADALQTVLGGVVQVTWLLVPIPYVLSNQNSI